MKQFRVMNPSTYAWRSVDEGELMSMMSTATDSLLAQWVPVGGEFTDSDGFQVARDADTDPDVAGAGQTSTARFLDAVDAARAPGERDERLERIALEYVRILLPAHINGLRLDCTVAEAAVRNAKSLIAELDKQA